MSRRFVDTTLACCVCGARAARIWRRAGDHLLGGPRCFQAVRCDRCGTVRLDPRPAPEEMARHYVPRTYARAEDGAATGTAERLDEGNRRIADRVVALCAEAPVRRALDVGCGDGRFVAALAARGWDAEGLETDPVAAELARRRTGRPVHEGALESLDLPEGGFGLVSLVHVLEHLPDPPATLAAARRLLAPGGFLFVAVPNAGSAEAALFRSCWYALDLPRHFWGFTPHTLARLAETAGFADVAIRHFPLVNSLQSLRFALRAMEGKPIGDDSAEERPAPDAPGSLRTRLFVGLQNLSETLGRTLPGEVMEMCARRSGEAGA